MGFIEESEGTIRVSGDLTFESVPQLVKKAPGFGGRDVVTVDLAGVDRIDSAGLALLLGWVRLARKANGSLSFINLPEQIQSLVRVAALESLLQAQDQAT